MPNEPTKKFTVQEIAGPDARKDTQQLPSALKNERLLESLIESVSKLDTNVQTLSKTVMAVAMDVSTIKTEREAEKTAVRSYSGQIKAVAVTAEQASNHNMEQDGAIAQTLTKVASVEAKVDGLVTSMAANTAMTSRTMSAVVVEGARGFLKNNPKIETAFAALILTALTVVSAVLYGWAKGHGYL